MHAKNGRPLKNGDKIVVTPPGGTPYSGILYDAKPGNDFCNGRVAVTHQNDPYVNLAECHHTEDVEKATIPNTAPVVAAPATSLDQGHIPPSN